MEILLRLLVWLVQAFGPADELDDHLVVEEVKLPCVSTGVLCVVIIREHFLLDVVDVQLAGDPLVRLISLELVCDDVGAELVFVHCLYLLIEDSCLTLD